MQILFELENLLIALKISHAIPPNSAVNIVIVGVNLLFILSLCFNPSSYNSL